MLLERPQFIRLTLDGPAITGSGRIAAGVPVEAVGESERDELGALIGSAGRYALRVSSDALCALGIFAGDLVIVQSQQQAASGDLVLALIDGDQVTLERVSHRSGGRLLLRGESPETADRELAAERVAIQGRVVGLIRRYR